jgi:hypothetical protein
MITDNLSASCFSCDNLTPKIILFLLEILFHLRDWCMAGEVESSTSKHKDLSSNHSIANKFISPSM